MQLALIDVIIILVYIAASIFLGFWISKRASKGLRSYFVGDNSMKWYWLGLSNSSGMFDINAVSWRVAMLIMYGFQSVWIPWIWPVWNQVFVMVFLAAWFRRSGAMTGAEWIRFRFGDGLGGRLSHIMVVAFAVIDVIIAIAYFFTGIGGFAAAILPWDLSVQAGGIFLNSEHVYALVICFLTTLYTIKGGIYSVVATEVMQFIIMVSSCILVVLFAINTTDTGQVNRLLPEGWFSFWPENNISLAWKDNLGFINEKMVENGYKMMAGMLMLMVGKGIMASLAGPVPGFDLQRTLSARSPKEASKMAGLTISVLFIPLYLMVGGFALIIIYKILPALQGAANTNLEGLLSTVIAQYLPAGLMGLIIAGLLAAFMSTFSAFVNIAPAYLINDLYKRYFKPNEPDRHYVRLSYATSIGIVILGIIIGFFIGRINTIVTWITAALYGGYAAANVLKWIWWRFNGYGYFFGMLAGMIAAVTAPSLVKAVVLDHFPQWSSLVRSDSLPLVSFFFIFLFSLAGSVAGCLLTKPLEEKVAANFYYKTRPWGFWGPIRRRVMAAHPGFKPNGNLGRDAVNVLVGITWEMSMVVLPLYVVFQKWTAAGISLGVLLITSLVLKYNWYNKLEED